MPAVIEKLPPTVSVFVLPPLPDKVPPPLLTVKLLKVCVVAGAGQTLRAAAIKNNRTSSGSERAAVVGPVNADIDSRGGASPRKCPRST